MHLSVCIATSKPEDTQKTPLCPLVVPTADVKNPCTGVWFPARHNQNTSERPHLGYIIHEPSNLIGSTTKCCFLPVMKFCDRSLFQETALLRRNIVRPFFAFNGNVSEDKYLTTNWIVHTELCVQNVTWQAKWKVNIFPEPVQRQRMKRGLLRSISTETQYLCAKKSLFRQWRKTLPIHVHTKGISIFCCFGRKKTFSWCRPPYETATSKTHEILFRTCVFQKGWDRKGNIGYRFHNKHVPQCPVPWSFRMHALVLRTNKNWKNHFSVITHPKKEVFLGDRILLLW